jgi:NAD-dependent deacetylase
MANIDMLEQMIRAASRIVAFTGAGISTESGIPDFRSPGGIWTRYRPIEFSDFLASEEMRRESWRRKFATEATLRAARPNSGHQVLARLVAQGRMTSIVTQNVDGLHQAAGVPVEKVIELHGNSTYAACLDCRKRHDLEWVKEIFRDGEKLATCLDCGGILKTATISFGQPMPEEEMQRAQSVARNADLMIVLGSSLVVYPAASIPIVAKRSGAKYVIINREPTEQDEIADLVIHAEIGPTLGRLSLDS